MGTTKAIKTELNLIITITKSKCWWLQLFTIQKHSLFLFYFLKKKTTEVQIFILFLVWWLWFKEKPSFIDYRRFFATTRTRIGFVRMGIVFFFVLLMVSTTIALRRRQLNEIIINVSNCKSSTNITYRRKRETHIL